MELALAFSGLNFDCMSSIEFHLHHESDAVLLAAFHRSCLHSLNCLSPGRHYVRVL